MNYEAFIGAILLIVLANILGIWRVTASQNRTFEQKFLEFENSFNEKFIIAERNVNKAFERVTEQFGIITLQITKILEGDIKTLRNDIGRTNEHLDMARSKIHDLGEMVNLLVLKVDRLERDKETHFNK